MNRTIPRTRIRGALAAVLSVALMTSACGGSSDESSDGTEKLVFLTTSAAPGTSTQVATQAVPDLLGYFDDEGVEVELETVDGATAAIQALAGNSGDASNPGLDSVLTAASKNVPVTTYASLVTHFTWQIAVDEKNTDLTEPADLKGRTIGIISLSSGSNFFARSWLQENGLDPDADVELLPVGTGPAALAALDDGKVDALALFGEPYASFEQAGRTFRYFDNPESFDDVLSLALIANNRTLADKKEALTRHARAMYKGLLFSAVNPEAAVRMKWEYWPETAPKDENDPENGLDAQVATLSAWVSSAIPSPIPDVDPVTWAKDHRWGEISAQQWDATQQYLVNAGILDKTVDLDQVWDDSLIDEINDWDRNEVIQDAKNWKP